MGLAQRVAAQRALAERTHAVAEQVVATVVDQVPAYTKLTETQLGEISAIAQWAITRLTDMWVDGTGLAERDLNRFRGIGAARAADGRPLMAVLRAYRVAAIAVTDAIVAHAPPTLTVDDLAALVRVLIGALDDLSEALFAGYQRRTGELATDRHRLLDELVHDLVTGRQTSPGALTGRTEQLNVRIPETFALLLAGDPAAGTSVSAADVDALTRALADPATRSAIADRRPVDQTTGTLLRTVRSGVGVVLLADQVDRGTVESAVAAAGWCGCLLTGTSAATLPHDYKLATAALDHAPTEAFARRHVLDRGDALTVAVLHGEPAVQRHVLHTVVLGGALADRQRHVLEGLNAYLQHGSATEAAAALGLHPQTMRHRLRRFTELTGRRLDDSWDRLVLQVARGSLLTRNRPDAGA